MCKCECVANNNSNNNSTFLNSNVTLQGLKATTVIPEVGCRAAEGATAKKRRGEQRVAEVN